MYIIIPQAESEKNHCLMGDVFQMLVMQHHQILSIKDSDINIYTNSTYQTESIVDICICIYCYNSGISS